MKGFRFIVIAMLHGCLCLCFGCTRNVHGGDPDLPFSSSNGTTQVFLSDEGSVAEAISNVFNRVGYRGMRLEVPAYSEVQNSTNQFVLFPFYGPIADVPLRGQPFTNVPYTASFHIVMKSEGEARTRVSIITVSPEVIDGEEVGIHGGGWVKHARKVPPVQQEEQHVLDAISNSLSAMNAKTNLVR